jgi:phage replication-related protein YjqB (UPF0714/DUF867 family)
MADKYTCWSELAKENSTPAHFVIHSLFNGSATWLVAAPHGGGIEPGTTEIAKTIADRSFGFYSVEGTKQTGNRILHITSHRFDEPTFNEAVRQHDRVLAIHGCDDVDRSPGVLVWVGGADGTLVKRAIATLTSAGYAARADSYTPGAEAANLCNRGRAGGGLQFELAEALRSRFFENLTRAGRRRPTDALPRFAVVVRELLGAA